MGCFDNKCLGTEPIQKRPVQFISVYHFFLHAGVRTGLAANVVST